MHIKPPVRGNVIKDGGEVVWFGAYNQVEDSPPRAPQVKLKLIIFPGKKIIDQIKNLFFSHSTKEL